MKWWGAVFLWSAKPLEEIKELILMMKIYFLMEMCLANKAFWEEITGVTCEMVKIQLLVDAEYKRLKEKAF